MADQMRKIVAELPDLTDVSGVCAVMDERVAQGDAAFVADLGIALARTYGTSGQPWQCRSALDHAMRLLAVSAGHENVTQALRLFSSAGISSRKLDRHAASLLASSHEAADLAEAFTGHASEELRACLVHELVLRGVAAGEAPGIAAWATSPHWRYHPLAWMPLTLSGMEEGADLPSYSAYGSGHAMPYGPSQSRELARTADAAVPSAQETTTEADVRAIGMAVANWTEESNGRVEARVFQFAAHLNAETVPGVIPTLGLECLGGAGRKTRLSVVSCPPAQAWRVLFAAASTGGAYGSGSYGAYGRLAAWKSVAALTGCPEGSSAAEVEARVMACEWYAFDADTKWFEQVAWDIGLATLSPDGRRLAVLAATDTD
ncbi:DUF6183 family protein [Streptomyces sp. NPDC051920]|uniref:DUF6183 family protein n=1 Tax=Streptomyces sp. NPDC051920 TaxID=3155523 RepID=UPI003440C867